MNDIQREKALYIGGRWVPGGRGDLEVENPATEELAGVVSQASAGDVDTAVAAARAAFPGWAATADVERAALLRGLRGVIAERAELFAGTVQREQGSPPRVAPEATARTSLAEQIASGLGHRSQIRVAATLTEGGRSGGERISWNTPLVDAVAVASDISSAAVGLAGASVALHGARRTGKTAQEGGRSSVQPMGT